MSVPPPLLTRDELAEILGVPWRYVYRLVERREIAFLKVGIYLRFRPEDVRTYIAANRNRPVSGILAPAGEWPWRPPAGRTREREGVPDNVRPLLTRADVAAMLGVDGRYVYSLVEKRELDFIRVGSQLRFLREDVDAYLRTHRTEADG